MVSNMLSVQSDCPHREKLPYGGDLVADSPAALAFFDMSSFYKKVRHFLSHAMNNLINLTHNLSCAPLKTIYDWLEAQWANGKTVTAQT
jgi:hypothetical protein